MLHRRLAELDAAGRTVPLGVIGAGTFGTQIIARVCRMAGMRVAAVADLDVERARRGLRAGGVPEDAIVAADGAAAINAAIDRGRFAVCSDPEALIASRVEYVVEATGNAEAGARHGHQAIVHGKHVVMVTIEADVVVGPILRRLAERAGVMYSLAYGDEPALACELVDWARTLGFRVIAAGKGTRFIPEFRLATPDDVPRLYGFTGSDYNAQVFCSFLDGTKHAIEMATLSNATGLVADVRGLHFPAVDLREMPDVLCLRSKGGGGLLVREGVVEAVSSLRPDGGTVERSLRGGVYAVFDGPDPDAIRSLASYGEIIGMIIGKQSGHAMIYRPQHFVGHEVPVGIGRMIAYGETVGAPIGEISHVIAAAKKPLAPGTILDGEGGYTVYGLVERAEVARRDKLISMGLTHGAVVREPIPAGGLISDDNVKLNCTFALELLKHEAAERKAATARLS
jgi:predicted homoserine dehydrogenase-like protein